MWFRCKFKFSRTLSELYSGNCVIYGTDWNQIEKTKLTTSSFLVFFPPLVSLCGVSIRSSFGRVCEANKWRWMPSRIVRTWVSDRLGRWPTLRHGMAWQAKWGVEPAAWTWNYDFWSFSRRWWSLLQEPVYECNKQTNSCCESPVLHVEVQ